MKKIAVLVPCYNEEATVQQVVREFRAELPDATIYVFDNASTDRTAELAKSAGADVRFVGRKGKGAVVRTMFRTIEADIYIMVDGDATYPARAVQTLLAPVLEGRADLCVGDRHSSGSYAEQNRRPFHGIGNAIVTRLINWLYASQLADIMSGYRVMTRQFVKHCPVLADGFQIETEMTLHALDKKFAIVEVPIEYFDRPTGSVSKLNTYRDGVRVLRSILWMFKDSRPLLFFGLIAALLAVVGVALGIPVVHEYLATGLVPRFPTAILAAALGTIAVLLLATGFILDTIVRISREQFEVTLLRSR